MSSRAIINRQEFIHNSVVLVIINYADVLVGFFGRWLASCEMCKRDVQRWVKQT